MDISQRIIMELEKQGKKQKDLSEFAGISTSAISAWNKNNTQPASDKLSLIADFLNVSLDYLVTGEEKGKTPKLHKYRWNFEEVTETDKLYNRVCYAIHMLHGKMRASAMLSAIGLSSDKPDSISEMALQWLSEKCKTTRIFFTDGYFETGKSDFKSLTEVAEDFSYYRGDFDSESSEVKKWEENYAYLFYLAVSESTNAEYVAEVFEDFSRYPNEQADLMAYIRQGIANFEDARQKRLDRRNAEMNAQKEETA